VAAVEWIDDWPHAENANGQTTASPAAAAKSLPRCDIISVEFALQRGVEEARRALRDGARMIGGTPIRRQTGRRALSRRGRAK